MKQIYDEDALTDDDFVGELLLDIKPFLKLPVHHIHTAWYPLHENVRLAQAVVGARCGQTSESQQMDCRRASEFSSKFDTRNNHTVATVAAVAARGGAGHGVGAARAAAVSAMSIDASEALDTQVVGSRGRILIGFEWRSLHVGYETHRLRVRCQLPSLGLSVFGVAPSEVAEVLYISLSRIFFEYSVRTMFQEWTCFLCLKLRKQTRRRKCGVPSIRFRLTIIATVRFRLCFIPFEILLHCRCRSLS